MTNENLTDLAESTEFQFHLRQAIATAQGSSRQIAALQIALDAHSNGVQLLSRLPDNLVQESFYRLRSVLRESDIITITDNGQLAIVLPSIRDMTDAEIVAGKISAQLQEGFVVNGSLIRFNPSIGVALFPTHGQTASRLIDCASAALTRARQTAASHVFFSAVSNNSKCLQLSMKDLRKAIVADDLYVLYQPKISLHDRALTSVEGLVRWKHAEHGTIRPDEFIPLAERTGLIIPLTLWVLKRALLQCADWQRRGLNVPVAVNLSMWNLEAPELPDQLNGLLQDTGVPPDKLVLEITESTLMGDQQRILNSLMRIRKLGVTFAIDDFGVGYSSLSYLGKLPVSSIKIDKSFVQNVQCERSNAVIVRSIVDLSHNLGLKVVAEGVEDAEAEKMMIISGCDEVQGYYYSRPIDGTALARFANESPHGLNQYNRKNMNDDSNTFAMQNLKLDTMY